jgi:hypothetical protein
MMWYRAMASCIKPDWQWDGVIFWWYTLVIAKAVTVWSRKAKNPEDSQSSFLQKQDDFVWSRLDKKLYLLYIRFL